MLRYIIGRLLVSIPVLLIISLIAFSLMQLVPGDPAMLIAGLQATPDQVQAVREQLGLDQPFHVQLLSWYGNLLQGDLGRSLLLGRDVLEVTLERLPVSLSIALYALLLTVVIGIAGGVLAALRQNTWVDQAVMTVALIGVSLPNFWLALMLIILFAVQLGWLPSGGYVDFRDDFLGWLGAATLPAVSLALLQTGLLARITRSTMLEVLHQDYIRTARAKGLPPHLVIGKHALKNVMIPVITVLGIVVQPAAVRLGGDRDDLFHPRPRLAARLIDTAPRLPGDPGRAAVRRGRCCCCSTCWWMSCTPISTRGYATTMATESVAAAPPRRRRGNRTLRRLLHHKLFISGSLLFGVVLFGALFADWLIVADPNDISFRNKFEPPGAEWLFGTDNFGPQPVQPGAERRPAVAADRSRGGAAEPGVRHPAGRGGRLFPPSG